jgi:hypothetical protein
MTASDKDHRIMLHMLVNEAQRFHALHPASARTTQPAFQPSPLDDLSSGSAISDATAASEESSEAWEEVRRRIDCCYEYEPPSNGKYKAVKGWLMGMFLWDARREWSEFDDATPQTSLQWIAERQVRRLEQLPQGQLFHPLQSHAIAVAE